MRYRALLECQQATRKTVVLGPKCSIRRLQLLQDWNETVNDLI
jgi:hypothetical protein